MKTWGAAGRWMAMNFNHDLARWILVGVGLGGLVAINMPWNRLRRTPKPQYKSRAVDEKKTAKLSWKDCVDSLILEGEQATDKKNKLAWHAHVIDRFTDYLTDPIPFIDRFEQLTADISKRGKGSDEAVKAGIQFLKAKRDTLAAHELK